LHPSKRLLLCGTDKAPAKRLSALDMKGLITIIEGLHIAVR
jgi:hypothetical protein